MSKNRQITDAYLPFIYFFADLCEHVCEHYVIVDNNDTTESILQFIFEICEIEYF